MELIELSDCIKAVDGGAKCLSDINDQIEYLNEVKFITKYHHFKNKVLTPILKDYVDLGINLNLKFIEDPPDGYELSFSLNSLNGIPVRNDSDPMDDLHSKLTESFYYYILSEHYVQYLGTLNDGNRKSIPIETQSFDELDELFLNDKLVARYRKETLTNELKDDNKGITRKLKV